MHLDTGPTATQFATRRFVGILEPAPAAYVIDQQGFEIGSAAFDIVQQALKSETPAEIESAFAFIGISLHNLISAPLSITSDRFRLIVGRILLMLGRHAHILGRSNLGRVRWGV